MQINTKLLNYLLFSYGTMLGTHNKTVWSNCDHFFSDSLFTFNFLKYSCYGNLNIWKAEYNQVKMRYLLKETNKQNTGSI